MSLLLALVTFVLVVISLFMVLVILMQRAKSDGGVGAALGGGMAESAFGGETANVLTKATQTGAVLFFVLAFGLYLGRIHQHRAALANPDTLLPSVEAPALPPIEGASATTPPAAPGGEQVTPTPGTAPAETPSPSPSPSDSGSATPPAAPGANEPTTPSEPDPTPRTP